MRLSERHYKYPEHECVYLFASWVRLLLPKTSDVLVCTLRTRYFTSSQLTLVSHCTSFFFISSQRTFFYSHYTWPIRTFSSLKSSVPTHVQSSVPTHIRSNFINRSPHLLPHISCRTYTRRRHPIFYYFCVSCCDWELLYCCRIKGRDE